MVVARVQMPDGKIGRFEVPEGTTPDQVEAYINNMSGSAETKSAPQKQPESDVSRLESGLRGAYDAATSGFGDEIQAVGGTPVDMAATALYDGLDKVSLSDSYGRALDTTRTREKEAQQQNPISYGTGQIAGAVGTGLKLAGTKAATAIGNSLRTGSLPVKALKGAAVGAASGGLYGFGSGEGGSAKRAESAGENAIYSGLVGGAVPILASAVKGAVSKKAPQITSDEIRALASQKYQIADQKGGFIPANYTDDFLNEINSLKPQTKAANAVLGETPTTQLIDRFQNIKGQPMSLKSLQELDEGLGDIIDTHSDSLTGRLTKEGKKLYDIQTKLRGIVDKVKNLPNNNQGFKALAEGRELWSAQAKLRDIEKIINRAEMTQNPSTAIQTGFRNLYNNPNRMKGYDAETKKLIKKAADTGVVGDLLGIAGSRLFQIGSLLAGGGLGGQAAAQAASIASRGLKSKAVVGKARNVANTVANKAVPPKLLPPPPPSRINPMLFSMPSAVLGSY